LNEIGKSDVYLSIKRIIIDSQRIGNVGLEFLCSQKVSNMVQLQMKGHRHSCHVNRLLLGKTIAIKLRTK
jgi:hypothetical protein